MQSVIVVNCFQIVILRSLTQPAGDHCQFCRVVNCFQIVILRSLTQLIEKKRVLVKGCELLSNCDFTIFDTTKVRVKEDNNVL